MVTVTVWSDRTTKVSGSITDWYSHIDPEHSYLVILALFSPPQQDAYSALLHRWGGAGWIVCSRYSDGLKLGVLLYCCNLLPCVGACVFADGNRKAEADCPLDVKSAVHQQQASRFSCRPVDQQEGSGGWIDRKDKRRERERMGNQMNHLEHNPFPLI